MSETKSIRSNFRTWIHGPKSWFARTDEDPWFRMIDLAFDLYLIWRGTIVKMLKYYQWQFNNFEFQNKTKTKLMIKSLATSYERVAI